MSFDNGVYIGNSAFVLAIGAYPLAVVICSILAWWLRGRSKRKAAIVNLIPMLWIVAYGLLFILV
ncbi:hypothetical protein [Peribacillus deserti]|nr:hypothetical protein [Peribacillus deserti]